MAENEILDVGNSKRYRRWKAALTNGELASDEVASILSKELQTLLKRSLRKQPLSIVLKACDGDKSTLPDAIESFTEKSLARRVAQAARMCNSTDPFKVGTVVADLVANELIDRANLHIGKDRYGLDSTKQAEIRRETIAKLEQSKPELTRVLCASLSGHSDIRWNTESRRRQSAVEVASLSLYAR